ncbi:MAG: hypothetical protein KDC39_08750 [Actinobacteria bacterium]|nr:hypothetical protein [Actinomycetota bacterium]
MADEDEIEKLLAEVNQMNQAGSAKPPAKKKGEVAGKGDDDDSGVSRIGWMLIAGVGSGIIGFLIGWLVFFIPMTAWSGAIGAAIGGAITALISGPPKWLE